MSIFTIAKPSAIEAVRRLSLPELLPVVEMIETAVAELKTSLVAQSDVVTIHRLQGKVMALEDFLYAVRHAGRTTQARGVTPPY